MKIITTLALAALIGAAMFSAYNLRSKVGGERVVKPSISYCGGDSIRLSNVEMRGSFGAGSTVTTVSTGQYLKDVTHAKTNTVIQYKLGFIWTTAANVDTPVEPAEFHPAGPLETQTESYLEDSAPSGSYKTTLRFYDSQGGQLQCILLEYKL